MKVYCLGYTMRVRRAKQLLARRGMAVVELALLLPLLCFLFVASVDFARVFYFDLTLVNAARNGAIYASQNPTTAIDTAGIKAAVQKDTTNLNVQRLTVTSSTSGSSPTMVVVTVSYPFTTITKYPGISSQFTLRRTIQMSVAPLTPN
jgi:Flp pilus assembly protein TadG